MLGLIDQVKKRVSLLKSVCLQLIVLLQMFHDEKVLMKRSWVEADFFCQALGAQLASVIHYEEEVFLRDLVSTMFERWYFPQGTSLAFGRIYTFMMIRCSCSCCISLKKESILILL